MSIHPVDALRHLARDIAKESGLTVDEKSFDAAKIAIDSNVKLPRSKAAREHLERIQRTFKAYADAYEAAHIKRPELAHVNVNVIEVNFGTHKASFTEKRLKELTRMLRDRVKDR